MVHLNMGGVPLNARQFAQRVQVLLQGATWPTGSMDEVFGAVSISVGATDKALAELRTPIVLITPEDATADDEHPDLITQSFALTLIVMVEGDELGEQALVGGPRPELGSSSGRGLLEVEEELLRTVEFLDRTDAVRIRMRTRSAPIPDLVEDLGWIVARAYRFDALLTSRES